MEAGAAPPPPPVRRGSVKQYSNAPPSPPHRDSTNYSSRQSGVRDGPSENGYGDYDIPRPSKTNSGYVDNDALQDVRKSSLVPQPQGAHSGSMARRQSHERESDYDVPLTKEERLRKEKVLSMLAAKQRYSIDDSSSDPSRPVSVNSSVYSADSASLNSSRSSSKLTLPTKQSSFDHDIDIIDKLVEDVALSKQKKLSVSSAQEFGEGGFDTLGTGSKVLSRTNLDEEGSSNSGSNDNLGVWDDMSYEEEDSDEAGGMDISRTSLCMYHCAGFHLDNFPRGREGGIAKA